MRIKKRKSISKWDGFRFGGPKCPYFELLLNNILLIDDLIGGYNVESEYAIIFIL